MIQPGKRVKSSGWMQIKRWDVVAGINGSNFDRESGGSVTYIEGHDSIIGKTKPYGITWAKPDSLINGVIIISRDSTVRIEPARSDRFYELSKQEAAAMVTGPLLLLIREKDNIPVGFKCPFPGESGR